MFPKFNENKTLFLSLIDALNLFFIIVLFGFLLSTRQFNPYTDKLIALYSIITIFIIALAYWRNKRSYVINNLYFIVTALIIFLVLYDSLSGLLPVFAGDKRYDPFIDNLDNRIFGISPSVWMESFAHPFLTEFLYLFYAIYFPLPFILVALLYRNKEYKELEIALFTIMVNYYGAYTSYFFFPVEGPRFYLADQHSVHLNGLFMTDIIRDTINRFEPSTLDCFPSLHTSTLIVLVLLTRKYYKKLLMPFFIISVIIISSLVYLRYHYLLDILAGIIWAVISYYISMWIFRRYSRYFHKHVID